MVSATQPNKPFLPMPGTTTPDASAKPVGDHAVSSQVPSSAAQAPSAPRPPEFFGPSGHPQDNNATRAHFEQKLAELTRADVGGLAQQQKRLADLLQQTGKASPVMANALLDAVKAHLEKSGTDRVAQMIRLDLALHGDVYSGLSMLVETADSLGGQRAIEIAGLLYKEMNAVNKGEVEDHVMKDSLRGNCSGMGLLRGTQDAVANHGAAKLSVALVNELKAVGGSIIEWPNQVRRNMIDQLGRGVAELHARTVKSTTDWVQSNEVALKFARDFGPLAPDQVASVILKDRKANPEAAKAADANRQKMEEQGLKVFTLMRGLEGLRDNEVQGPSSDGVRSLGQALSDLDGDAAARATWQRDNTLLQRDIAAKLQFGQMGGDAMSGLPEASVKQIKTDLQAIGMTTSISRLCKNIYADTGSVVMHAYMQLASRQALKTPKQAWSPGNGLVANAAHLLHVDRAQIKASVKYMKDFETKVAKLTAAGPLSAEQRAALSQEFRHGMSQISFDPTDVGRPDHPRSRFLRLLAATCFVGSATNNGVNAANESGVTSSEAAAVSFAAGAVRDFTGRPLPGTQALTSFLGTPLNGKGPVTVAGNLAKGFLAATGPGSFVGLGLTVGDIWWLHDDLAANDTKGANLTAGVVAGDMLELTPAALGTAAGRAALVSMVGEEAAALRIMAAMPYVGWAGAVLGTGFLAARFAHGVEKAKHQYEFDAEDPASRRYTDMARSLGFKDPTLEVLLQNNRGGAEVKGPPPQLTDEDAARSVGVMFNSAKAYFTEGGMSPMHVLNLAFDHMGATASDRLELFQSLNPEELKALVKKTHKILDHQMTPDGEIPPAVLDTLAAHLRALHAGKGAARNPSNTQ